MIQKLLAFIGFPLTIASGFAQSTYTEIEPNETKAQATVIPPLAAGDSVVGTTQVWAGPIDYDYYLLRTAVLPPGVYRHRLTFSSLPGIHLSGGLLGTKQNIVPGVGGVPTTEQTLITDGNPTQWYGFGKGERFYLLAQALLISGPGPGPNYVMTLSTTSVPITVITPAFESSSPIAITTMSTSTQDTSIHVYDAGFNAIPGYSNDDESLTRKSRQSFLRRNYAPGTYYIALGSGGTAWNLGAPLDENFRPANDAKRDLMEFPDAIARPVGSTPSWSFRVIAGNGVVTQPAAPPGSSPADILWFQFTVAAGAPTLNETCSSATVIVPGESYPGWFGTAVNDGASSCDPGGSTSRDLWFRYSNAQAAGVVLHLDTCGSAADTALGVFASCGGAELACNDDCGGGACGPTSSCASLVVNGGQTVFVRVSDKGLGGAPFVLNTSTEPSNDECTTPKALPGAGVFVIDNAFATTSAAGQGEAACNFPGGTAIARDLWYTYTPLVLGPVQISTCGLVGAGPNDDSKIAVYAGTNCPTPGSAIVCSDTTTPVCGGNATVTFNTTCGTQYLIQIGMSPLSNLSMHGSFQVQELGPVLGSWCSTPFTKFCTGEVVGATCTACGNNGQPGRGCANSVYSQGADLSIAGIASVTPAFDTLTLTATDITGPGVFVQATYTAGPFAYGDGWLCAAALIIRLGIVFPTGGVASYPGGLTPVPIHTAGAPLAPGVTRFYQCWYRDAATFCSVETTNFTSAIALTWYP